MRRLRCLLLTLILSSLALATAPAQLSTTPSSKESTTLFHVEQTLESQPGSSSLLVYGPYSLEELTKILEAASKAAALTAAKAAVDEAVPLAVRTAVAEGAAATAAAEADRDNYKAEAKVQAGKVLLFGIGGIAVGILADELFGLIKALVSK
jgi:hypothetical protein